MYAFVVILKVPINIRDVLLLTSFHFFSGSKLKVDTVHLHFATPEFMYGCRHVNFRGSKFELNSEFSVGNVLPKHLVR